MTQLKPGDTAPDFELTDADGAPVRLRDFSGRKVILYFYPAAGTPGCTTEACDFRDNMNSLTGAGYTVLGVSRDDAAALEEFREGNSLTFPLLSDPDHAVHEAYGAWGEKVFDGKTVVGPLRSTVVIDGSGVVEHVMYNVNAAGHVRELRSALGADG